MDSKLLSDLAKLLVENTEKHGNPLGLDESICIRWRSEIREPPRYGEQGFVFYTGCLYQYAPFISSFRKMLENLYSKRAVARLALKVGSIASQLGRLIARPPEEEIKRFNSIPLRIYRMLERAGIPLKLPKHDIYSGILLYELGLDDYFAKHARRVYSELRRTGSKVVTIDPHTYYALKTVYPKFIEGYDLEVYHYMELLSESSVSFKGSGRYSVHDSCYLTRHMGILERVRKTQGKVNGVEYLYPTENGYQTGCCGGPIEVLFPKLSLRIAESRLSQLKALSQEIIAFCPICIVNLGHAARQASVVVKDFSEVVSLE